MGVEWQQSHWLHTEGHAVEDEDGVEHRVEHGRPAPGGAVGGVGGASGVEGRRCVSPSGDSGEYV